MNHVNTFKGRPPQDAPWKVVQLWYKTCPPDQRARAHTHTHHLRNAHWCVAVTALWQTGLMGAATLKQTILAYEKSMVLMPLGC